MHSVAGLLHANFRLPALDYEDLLKLTSAITRREDDLHSMFRIAAFNIIFHNRDDHSKNFSFLMSESGEWRLAPAYDLTWSRGPGGEHTTAVLGEGKTPTKSRLIVLAEKRGIDRRTAEKIVSEVEAGKQVMLDLLRQYGIKSHPVLESLKAVS
jgi:serine/threonine-protein kinase HipA